MTIPRGLPRLRHDGSPPAARDTSLSVAAFDSRASAWEEYTATPLGALRTSLALQNLQPHLEALRRTTGLDILDAGSGTGSYALPLAEQGHRVCLLDFSPEMLEVARSSAGRLGAGVMKRLSFKAADVDEVSGLIPPESYDGVLCHTLLEYVADVGQTIRALAGVLRSGGLVSVLFVTPYADALRWAIARADPERALQALHGPVSTSDLFGVERRVLTPEQVRQTLADAGVTVVAEYGVRIFADHLPPEMLADSDFFARLWELEAAAGRLDPYRQVGRYRQIIGQKGEAA